MKQHLRLLDWLGFIAATGWILTMVLAGSGKNWAYFAVGVSVPVLVRVVLVVVERSRQGRN